MKERIETITNSFVDYAGKTHHFVIAAISKELPRTVSELHPEEDDTSEVFHEVEIYVEDYGCENSLCSVTKALYLGISICNPTDKFNEEIGIRKAIARARNSEPVLLSRELGTINTKVVRALLEQEAEYLKNNPENFIKGYSMMRDAYCKKIAMNVMNDNFSTIEKEIVKNLEKDPNFLDNVMEYLDWQKKHGKTV